MIKILSLALYLILYFYNNVQALELKGNFIEGGLVRGKVDSGLNVDLDGKNINVYKDGTFIIGFHRDSPKNSVLIVKNKEKIINKKFLQIKQRKYKVQKINGLNESKVSPPLNVLERINREYREIKKARSIFISKPYHKVGFIMPAKGIITGVYGSQRILNGKPRRPHFGLDIAAPIGTDIYASCDGEVIYKGIDLYFSGTTLIISHGQGLTSTYLHLNSISVQLGQLVKKGDLVAKMGKTGRVTGPHLDWRMELNGKRIDPQLLIK